MGDFSNIKDHCYKPGQSGNPGGFSKKGREKKAAKLTAERQLIEFFGQDAARKLKKNEMTKEDMDFWDRKLITMGTPELQALAKIDECPIYAKNQAFAMILDTKNGRTTTIDKIRERIVGKQVQKIELTGADGTPLVNTKVMTAEEAKAMWEQLEKRI